MKLYIESDNGGRSIACELNGLWFFDACSPDGTFCGIDILEGSDEDAASRIRSAIDQNLIDLDDLEIDIDYHDDQWKFIPEYKNLSSDEIEEKENSGRDFDLTTFTRII